MPHIKSYNGKSILYSIAAPSSVVPDVGELIFYGQITELFPVGVCARVTSSSRESDGVRINIETVDPSEIFSEYFYAGDSSDPELQKMAKIMSHAPGYNGNLGSINLSTDYVNAGISLDVEFTDVVFNPRRHFYHLQCILKPKAEIGLNIDLDKTESKKTYLERTRTLTPIALVFIPSFDFAAFLKIEAALKLKLDLTREFAIMYEWTRQNGSNIFSEPLVMRNNAEPDDLGQVKTYIQLDGEIFTGLEIAARFGLIGDLAGAGIRVNAGPRFTGELGYGVLRNLSEIYNPETYAKGVLAASIGIDWQIFLYYKTLENLFNQEFETEDIGPKLSFDFLKQEHNLFPPFENTTCITTSAQSLVTRTEVSEPIVYPVEVGFNVETEGNEEPIATAFLDEVLDANNDEPLGLTHSFEGIALPYNKLENTYINPVFNYDGFVIKAKPSYASKNMYYNYFAHAKVAGASIIGGAVDVRTKTHDGTCMLIGNYFPRFKKNQLFSFDGGYGINLPIEVLGPMIYGTWQNESSDEEEILIFNTDLSGEHNGASFTFVLNKPQAGDIKIKFDDSEHSNLTYTIIELTDDILALKKKGKSTINIYRRK